MICYGNELSFAQVSNYTFEQASGLYTEISGGTVLGRATGNGTNAEGLHQQIYLVGGLPFSFLFNGRSYNQFYVHSTGYITFGRAPEATNHLAILLTGTYDGAIQAWRSENGFANIGGRTSELRWAVVGNTPNREIVIQWKDFRVQVSTSNGVPPSNLPVPFMNYQIRLRECTNIIEIIYGESGLAYGSLNSTTSAQVGLRGANISDFNNRTNSSSVSINSSVAGTVNSAVQSHTTVNATPGRHANGKIYRWTPPCYVSQAPAIITAPISICQGDSMTLKVRGGFLGSCARPQWFLGACGGIPIGTDTSITVLPTGNETYYVNYSGDCNTTDCISFSASSLEIIQPPQPPASLTGPAFICPGQSVQLTATGNLATGSQWVLFAGNPATGGIEVGRNTTGVFNVTPNVSTEYIVLIEGKAPCLFQSVARNFRVQVADDCICDDTALVVAYADYNTNHNYVERCTDVATGWTYYSKEGASPDTVYFAINKTPGLAPLGVPNGNTTSFQAKVRLTVDANPLGATMNAYDQTDGSCEGNFVMRRYWNVAEMTGGAIDTGKFVTTRFYFPQDELQETINRANRWAGRIPPAARRAVCDPDEVFVSSGIIFKTFNDTPFNHLGMIQPTTINFGRWMPTYLSSIPSPGFQQGKHYYDMSWPGFSGGGIAVRVSPADFVLPVTLVDFKGVALENHVLLEWETASELNNDHFVIERSLDATDFQPIGQLAGSGTTSEPRYYQLKDFEPSMQVNYYRLRQVDYDGKYEYSNTIAVDWGDIQNFQGIIGIYPNPSDGWVNVSIASKRSETAELNIYDFSGRLQLGSIINLSKGMNAFELDLSGFSAGAYVLSFSDSQGQAHHAKLVLKN